MLRWALVFALISLIAGVFGYTDIAVASAGIAKFICFLFLALFVVFAIAGVAVSNRLRGMPRS